MRETRKRNGRRTRRQKGGGSDLMVAVRNGDYVRVVHLIAARANVNYVDPEDAMTPLMIAVHESEPDDIKIVQRLLAGGANVNYRTPQGKTPLSEALRHIRNANQIKQIKQLIKAGANVNARNEDGDTPLLQVLHLEGGDAIQLQLVKALIAARADVNLPSVSGRRPLSFAINEVRTELIAAGATEFAAPRQRRREGFAVEVHDAYDKLHKSALLAFLQGKVGVLGAPSVDMHDHIYVTMKGFLSHSSPKSMASLDDVYAKRLIDMNFTESEANIIQYVLEFVKHQPNEFKRMYASTFVQDCAQAYNEGNMMSCSKGIKERIIFSLSSACAAYADRSEFEENGYSTIIRILNPPSLKALITQYARVCLREDVTKRQFRECMLPKLAEGMGVYYDEAKVVQELNQFIADYEEAAGEFPSTPKAASKGSKGSPKSKSASKGGFRTRRNRNRNPRH